MTTKAELLHLLGDLHDREIKGMGKYSSLTPEQIARWHHTQDARKS